MVPGNVNVSIRNVFLAKHKGLTNNVLKTYGILHKSKKSRAAAEVAA